jgi:NAD(P)-dependent dehydrogenase (short-subunit alcohol dehydrogenase family)
MTFANRVCAITGAASGIGRALALELAERGSDLALSDVDEDGLAETVEQAAKKGRTVTSARVDVSDRKAVHEFAERTIDAHGKCDAIVNNAGVTVAQTVNELTYEDLDWIVGINFWGVIHGTKAFLPHMLSRGDGWIVNISSVFGFIAVPGQSAYNATKFAVRGFTESLRQELAGTGVTAACVHPGGIKTNIVRRSRFHRTHDGLTDKAKMVEEFDKMARTSPASAAKTIADGMQKRSPRILIGADAHFIEAMQRMVPVRYPTVIGAVTRSLASRRAR